MDLHTPIIEINRVGKTMASRLKALGINMAGDLLFYLPFRYDDFSASRPIGELITGSRANVVGEIELINNKRSHRSHMAITEALISDDSGTVRAVWFNQPFLVKNLKVGDRVSLSGKVDEEYGQPVMVSPVYEKINPHPNPLSAGRGSAIHTQGLVPNYSLTANLTQKQIRFLINQVLILAKNLDDWLPEDIKKENQLIDLDQAIYKIHAPKNLAEVEAAKKRLAFDELLGLQLRAQMSRSGLKKLSATPVIFKEEATKNFVAGLPFVLTNDQKKSAWEIIKNIGQTEPMTRLLEGDVGSGKTIVALLAILNTALNKLQSALLVPTEVLANQHFASLGRLLAKTDLKIALLTANRRELFGAEKIKPKELLEKIKNGEVDVVIGTHALIQEKVEFKNLSLAVVDEQHRFGVEQRQALLKKSPTAPHLLSMTATPIPRSLALALYDDLSLSIIKEQPQGRLPIITKIFIEDERDKAYELIRQEVKNGRQAFVICPLIEESDKLGSKSATAEYERLSKNIFPEFKIGLLHGKLKVKDKNKAMEDFAAGKTQILVATAVVEVGIDVPNATVMMVESADRFGLAQLHQYRGRVGRGDQQSYCLLAEADSADKAKERLRAMLEFNNGFDLAKADLKFRGPGEVYGTLQKGFAELKVASLFDFALMSQAKEASRQILALSSDLAKFPEIRKKLGEWEKLIHLE
jgi:ATP-dependent DNA helicase RecG